MTDPRPLSYALLKREPTTPVITLEDFGIDDLTKDGGIRCPLCEWQPGKSSRWFCLECQQPEGFSGGCGTAWNTFETRGLCPGCHHQWRWTSCLLCGGWSPHDDWYIEEGQP
jgi:hypothetical protein